jgi:hypothetical protein
MLYNETNNIFLEDMRNECLRTLTAQRVEDREWAGL